MDTPVSRRAERGAANRGYFATCLGALLFLCVFVSACATAPAETRTQKAAEPPNAEPPKAGPSKAGPSKAGQLEPGVYSVASGERLERAALYDRLSNVQYVVVGESHDSGWDHRVQRRVYRALLERRDGPVALGMEMFQRPFQSPLDAYVAGDVDEETMLDRAEWTTRWGMATEAYAKLWRMAKETGSPLVALNARRELSKRVAQVGLDDLEPELRQELPSEMDLQMAGHRDLVRRAFGAHGPSSEEAFERFYQAQVVWDETMAHTAVTFMRSNPDVASMVIVCGRFHAWPAFGIPPRIERRAGGDVATALLPISEDSPEAEYSLAEMQARGVADYVWVR